MTTQADSNYRATAGELRQYVEQVERAEADMKSAQDNRKDIYAAAKSAGYDVAVMKELVKLRKKDADDVAEADAVLGMYKQAMGMA